MFSSCDVVCVNLCFDLGIGNIKIVGQNKGVGFTGPHHPRTDITDTVIYKPTRLFGPTEDKMSLRKYLEYYIIAVSYEHLLVNRIMRKSSRKGENERRP